MEESMKYQKLMTDVDHLLKSSDTFQIIASTEGDLMKTVICQSSYSGDLYVYQSSYVDNHETNVDMIRLTPEIYTYMKPFLDSGWEIMKLRSKES